MSRLPDLARVSSYAKSGGGASVGGRVMLGACLVSALLGLNSWFKAFGAQREIDFRKKQLSKPVYKMTEEEMVNPPWNYDNLDQWLYRRVEVVGRPIERLAMNIRTMEFNEHGYEHVVPLVTREDENYENRHGLLFNMGFIPFRMKSPSVRHRIDRVDRQKFVGFVSVLSELRNKSLIEGNAYHKGRLFYTCADVEDLGKSSELLNKEQASVAVVEKLIERGILDERHYERRGVDAAFSEPYPWAKTEAGALQLDKMPWNHRTDAHRYFILSAFTFLVGASIF